MQYLVKIIITTILVIAISEAAKRNQAAGAILASLPTTSIIALAWFFHETRDKIATASLASDIFFMVVPSLAFFIAFPLLLRRDFSFSVSLLSSSVLTAGCYFAFIKIANLFR